MGPRLRLSTFGAVSSSRMNSGSSVRRPTRPGSVPWTAEQLVLRRPRRRTRTGTEKLRCSPAGETDRRTRRPSAAGRCSRRRVQRRPITAGQALEAVFRQILGTPRRQLIVDVVGDPRVRLRDWERPRASASGSSKGRPRSPPGARPVPRRSARPWRGGQTPEALMHDRPPLSETDAGHEVDVLAPSGRHRSSPSSTLLQPGPWISTAGRPSSQGSRSRSPNSIPRTPSTGSRPPRRSRSDRSRECLGRAARGDQGLADPMRASTAPASRA